MRQALVRCNADMCQKNADYVVRITGSDVYGKKKLKPFISVGAKFPVIATTSELLSTGSDCKMTKLIVLDQIIGSMTKFKQIIGRGTRIREKDHKTHFVVMDFRNVTRLFADPEWDGPIQQDPNWLPQSGQQATPPSLPPVPPDPPSKPHKPEKLIVDANGCRVRIINKTVSIYDTDGKLLRQEDIIDYTRANIVGKYASLANFISQWTQEEKKEKIRDLLLERGINLDEMKKEKNMENVDDFDFICHVAFDQRPLTRRERANNVKKRDFLSKYSGAARTVLEALLEHYANIGIYDMKPIQVLELDPFNKIGSKARIAQLFGGREAYLAAFRELENELYQFAG